MIGAGRTARLQEIALNWERMSTMANENQTEIQEILKKFKLYIGSEEGSLHLEHIAREKKEVNELMEKLESTDKNSDEFVDVVLYGLLPYYKTSVAKRVSIYAVFMNIKPFFSPYNYSENEWRLIAHRIYDLCKGFKDRPDQIESLIAEFTKDKYSQNLQCGSITPILYCINDSYPIINNRVRRTYSGILKIVGIRDKMSQKLENYPKSIEKLRALQKVLTSDSTSLGTTLLDMFCYWYDEFILKETDTEISSASEDNNIEEVNFNEFFRETDIEKADYTPHALSNPERIKVRDIISNVEKRWVLPNFQRYFDWQREDVRSFLESIFKDYYVGAFLLWEAGKEAGLDLIPVMGLPELPAKPEEIILDGQQRITSLYYAMKAPDFPLKHSRERSYFYVNFRNFFQDNKENIVEVRYEQYERDECYKKLLFPLYELESYKDWIDGFEEFLLNNNKELDFAKLRPMRRIIERRLQHIWDGFEVPYILLPDSMKLKQVTEIFENINTKGKPLNVFDLLIARLLVNGIELRKLWNATLKEYPKIKNYANKTDKIPIYILQTMSLTYHEASLCSREDILNIYDNIFKGKGKIFEEEWNTFAKYFDKAISKIENVRSGYGAKDEREVPFIPMLPILATLLKYIGERKDMAECYKKLDRWYWASVFSNAYSSAVDSRLTSDFKEMKMWFDNDNEMAKSIINASKKLPVIDFRGIQTHGSSMYKGVLCLLALQGARDMDTNLTFENAESNHRDHLFPKSKTHGFGEHGDVDSILNITWMSEKTNTRIKLWKKPSVYIKEFIKDKYKGDEKEFRMMLKTHFIDDRAYEHMLSDNFESFVQEREKSIRGKIEQLIGRQLAADSGMISPDTPFSNRMAFHDTIKQCSAHLYWIDKYFSTKGLQLLEESLDNSSVNNVKILMAVEKVDETFRSIFKEFQQQLKNKGVNVELRVLTDNKLSSSIHDRWILSKNQNFNIPSPDTIARGQFSEIKKTSNTPPFDKWWAQSQDIIQEWNTILQAKKEITH